MSADIERLALRYDLLSSVEVQVQEDPVYGPCRIVYTPGHVNAN
jgi:hypothetical protein